MKRGFFQPCEKLVCRSAPLLHRVENPTILLDVRALAYGLHLDGAQNHEVPLHVYPSNEFSGG